jgi:hypothetical protein
VRVLQQESHSYSDPITEFLEDLYANFDFDAAQKKLRECENVRPPFTHAHLNSPSRLLTTCSCMGLISFRS